MKPGVEVIRTARSASYHPAIAMLTAFPVADEDWQSMGADKMLVKPMHTRVLLEQIEKLLAAHEAKLSIWSTPAPAAANAAAAAGRNTPKKRIAAKSTAKVARAKKAAKKPRAKSAKKK